MIMVAKITQQQALDDFRRKHGDLYDYTKVNYTNTRTEIEIICPVHGSFFQTPEAHKTRGCPKCGRSNKTPRITQHSILVEFEKIHSNRYDYSRVKYISATKKVEIICKKHGSFFQTPNAHKNGSNCPDCVRDNRYSSEDKNMSQFIAVHGNTYDYSKVRYYSNQSEVEIICKKHGSFLQKPAEHKRGEGCPYCAKENNAWNNIHMYKNRKTILYYVKINDLYKIGLTLKSVKSRFYSEVKKGINIEIIKTWEFDDGEDAFKREQQIIFENRKFRYVGENILSGGNSELFTTDILGLD